MKFPVISEKSKFWSTVIICISLYVIHFINILKYAINIPFYDEWEAITAGGILANPTLAQIFAQHNEHRIVTTNLLTLLLYELDGWNLRTHIAVNFVIYGLLIILLCYIVKKCVPQLSSWVILCFAFFLFSTISWENHFWAFQSQFHFALLFLLLSIFFLFNDEINNEKSWGKLLLGVFFSWLAIYSFSSGLVEILITLFCFIVFKLIRVWQNSDKQREALQLITGSGLIGGAIGLYFVGYVRPEYHPELVFPFQREFWIYFFNLLENGFGVNSIRLLPGVVILLFILIPVIGEMVRSRTSLSAKHWVIISAILAVLGALCSITVGRAGFHSVEQSKSSRYCEIAEILIPLTVAMWTIFLNQREQVRNWVLTGFWLFCMISFSGSWNFSKVYRENAGGRETGKQCVENYYHNGGEANCSTIYPAPIADRLELSRSLKVSFEEQLNSNSSSTNAH